jgi:hypothetical protein
LVGLQGLVTQRSNACSIESASRSKTAKQHPLSSWLRCKVCSSNGPLKGKRDSNQRHHRPHPPASHPRRRTLKLRRIAIRTLHYRNVPLHRSSLQTSCEVLLELDAVPRGRVVVITPFAAADELDFVGTTALLHYCRGCVGSLGYRAPFGGHVCVWKEGCDGAGAAEAGCLGLGCGHGCFLVLLVLSCELRSVECGVDFRNRKPYLRWIRFEQNWVSLISIAAMSVMYLQEGNR